LIWIKSKAGDVDDQHLMQGGPRPQIRHCPLCGVAMQASKSDDALRHFDTFHCLTCQTTIRVEPPAQSGRASLSD